MGKDTDVLTVQPEEPTVSEATRDKAPPIRTELSVLVNNKEYKLLPSKLHVSEMTHAYEFSDHDLPVHLGKDTVVLGEQEQQRALESIACVNEPLMIPSSSEGHPNQVADPEAVGSEAKEMLLCARERENERQLKEIRGELRDPKMMTILARLLSHPDREKFCIFPGSSEAVSERGRQCGGGGGGSSGGTTSNQGGQSESSSSQGGQAALVVGGLPSGGGGGGGIGGAGDDDPNEHRPFDLQSSHYNEHMVIEEQAEVMTEDEILRHALASLDDGVMMFNDPLFPQFTNPHEEPMSASLDCMRPGDLPEMMDFDISAFTDPIASLSDPVSDLSQYLPENMAPVEPAEESMAATYQPVTQVFDQPSQQVFEPAQLQMPYQEPLVVQLPHSQQIISQQSGLPQGQGSQFAMEESSDIKASIELIHIMRGQPMQRPRFAGQPLSLSDNVLSYPGVAATSHPPPSPAPSTHSSRLAPTPSPRPPFTPASIAPPPSPLAPPTPASLASPCPPLTPATPAPPTPASCRPCGPFLLDTFISGDSRICQLSIAPDISPTKRNLAVRAMLYFNFFYETVRECADQVVDLKVANDVNARMCSFSYEDESDLKVALSMPRHCKPLKQWLKGNPDLKDRLLVLQQILNSIATIHTRGHEERVSLWGSFMVWVARDLRVYLLVDFPQVLSRQQEEQMKAQPGFDPRSLDVSAVGEIFTNLVQPCIGKNDSWASPALSNALQLFQMCLSGPRSASRVAEAARILGEKRVCKVEVDAILPVVFFCLEREELQTALRNLSCIVPATIATVWAVESATRPGTYMRLGDIVTADRRMQLRLKPWDQHQDPRQLFIRC